MAVTRASRYLDSLGNRGIEPSLQAIEALCAELGRPQESFRVVQVTGTNGKTSTSRGIAALLSDEGLRVGLYTSPHLVAYNERFSIDGRVISDSRLDSLVAEVTPAIRASEKLLSPRRITQFEALTAMSLLFFAQEKVSVAVLEVGMGARWDATSVAEADVGVITTIGLDHADYLGASLSKIAAEKAFVSRSGNRVVLGKLPTEAMDIVEQRANLVGSRLFRMGEDFDFHLEGEGLFAVAGLFGKYGRLPMPKVGGFQVGNLTTALVAAELIVGGALQGDVAGTFGSFESPGRMQLVGKDPAVLFDGAHNPQGAAVLANELVSMGKKGRVIFVLSVLGDKDVVGVLQYLTPVAKAVVCTTNGNPRALKPEALARLLGDGHIPVSTAVDLKEAMAAAKRSARTEDLICVTGSLYGVGEALSSLAAR